MPWYLPPIRGKITACPPHCVRCRWESGEDRESLGASVVQRDDSSCKPYTNQSGRSLEISSGYKLCYSGAQHPGSPFSGNISPHNLVRHQRISTGFGRQKELTFALQRFLHRLGFPTHMERTTGRPALLLSATKCQSLPTKPPQATDSCFPHLSLSRGVFNYSTQTWTALLHLYPLYGSRPIYLLFFFCIISLSI